MVDTIFGKISYYLPLSTFMGNNDFNNKNIIIGSWRGHSGDNTYDVYPIDFEFIDPADRKYLFDVWLQERKNYFRINLPIYVLGVSSIARLSKKTMASLTKKTYQTFSINQKVGIDLIPPRQDLVDGLWTNRLEFIDETCLLSKLPIERNQKQKEKAFLAYADTLTRKLLLTTPNIPQFKAKTEILDYCTSLRHDCEAEQKRHRHHQLFSSIFHSN